MGVNDDCFLPKRTHHPFLYPFQAGQADPSLDIPIRNSRIEIAWSQLSQIILRWKEGSQSNSSSALTLPCDLACFSFFIVSGSSTPMVPLSQRTGSNLGPVTQYYENLLRVPSLSIFLCSDDSLNLAPTLESPGRSGLPAPRSVHQNVGG